jgi:hypothetical protein
MKIYLLVLIIVLSSCWKSELPTPTCKRVYCLSERYTIDMKYIRTDTLWPFGRLHNDFCGSDTLQFVNPPILFLCADSTYEIKRYILK